MFSKIKFIFIVYAFSIACVKGNNLNEVDPYIQLLQGCPEGVYREYAELHLYSKDKNVALAFPNYNLNADQLNGLMQFLIHASDKDLNNLIQNCFSSNSFFALDILMQLKPPLNNKRKINIIVKEYKKFIGNNKVSKHNFDANYIFCRRWSRHHDFFKKQLNKLEEISKDSTP